MQWPYPNSFLTLQMVASILVVYAMKAWGLATVQPLQLRAAKALCPVVFFYNTNVAFALAAVKSLSIPVYHVLKRLTPVMVLIAKFILGGAPPSKEVTLSVLTVVSGWLSFLFRELCCALSFGFMWKACVLSLLGAEACWCDSTGCIMAGIGDLSFEWSGYSAAFISCALQSTYLLLVERSGSEKGELCELLLIATTCHWVIIPYLVPMMDVEMLDTPITMDLLDVHDSSGHSALTIFDLVSTQLYAGFNSMELLLYNGILSLPVLIGVIFATGEVWDAAEKIIVESRASLMFLPLLAASLLMGSLLNYCLFLCTLCNSALTTTIVGTLRSVLGTVQFLMKLPLKNFCLFSLECFGTSCQQWTFVKQVKDIDPYQLKCSIHPSACSSSPLLPMVCR